MRNLIFLLLFSSVGLAQTATVPLSEHGGGTLGLGVLLNGMYTECTLDPGVFDFLLSNDDLEKMIDNGFISERDITYDSTSQEEGGYWGYDRKVTLKSLTIGDVVIRDVVAYIAEELGPVSVIGQSVLRRYKSYSIDNTNFTITIEKMPSGGKCIEGDCTNGYGHYRFDNGEEYRGNFINGEYHGFGMFTWANGNFYLGNFVKSVREGSGTYYYNGRAIQGNWVGGKCEGKFVLRMPDGSSSVVMFKDDKLIENGECH